MSDNTVNKANAKKSKEEKATAKKEKATAKATAKAAANATAEKAAFDKASKDAAEKETNKLVTEFTNTITDYNKYITQIKSDYRQKNIIREESILEILKKIMKKLKIE
jgi:hypothetical protein